MGYTYDRLLPDVTMDDADMRMRASLGDNGFGVLTEIDVEMHGYRILGACNPKMAHEAIGLEPRVGAMLPCNLILRQVDGGVEISAIDPVASMAAIDNADLKAVARQVRDLLRAAVDAA